MPIDAWCTAVSGSWGGGVECVIIISRMTEVVMKLNNWEISFFTKVEMICQTLPPPLTEAGECSECWTEYVIKCLPHLVPDSLAALGI